ncbi:MAG TPA: hypothetical protein VH418_11630 [Solirubrobacteraceae bacterium]
MQRVHEVQRTSGDERAARRSLRAQVARLEGRLAALTVDTYPHIVTALPGGPAGAARLLSLGDLERERDRLVARLATAERAAAQQAAHQASARALLEAMLADPPAHRFRRVANADLGLPGCTVYEVRPRLGPLGLLMDWWRVKISSGCPLA